MRRTLTGDREKALSPICSYCRHLRDVRRCDAFPDEIPLVIWNGENDHRQPFNGDHGIRFEPLTEDELVAARATARQSAILSDLQAQRDPVIR